MNFTINESNHSCKTIILKIVRLIEIISVVAERCIRMVRNRIYKYMTSISENVYIDKLNIVKYKYS